MTFKNYGMLQNHLPPSLINIKKKKNQSDLFEENYPILQKITIHIHKHTNNNHS